MVYNRREGKNSLLESFNRLNMVICNLNHIARTSSMLQTHLWHLSHNKDNFLQIVIVVYALQYKFFLHIILCSSCLVLSWKKNSHSWILANPSMFVMRVCSMTSIILFVK